jgi:predicted metal-dependent peptidase
MGVAFDDRFRLRLYFNASYIRSITREERKAVVVHELNHVVFNHLRTPPWGKEPQDPAKHDHLMRAWTLACEASANEYVPYELPGTPITYASLGLPPGESTEKRFSRLRKRKDLRYEARDFMDNLVRHDKEGIVETSSRRPTELAAAAKGVVVDALAELGGEIPDWLDGLLRHDGTYSNLEKLGRTNSRQIRWDTLLRSMVRRAADRRTVRNWPSRRRPRDVGVIPGHRSRRSPCTVLVAIDTSGSMSTAALEKVSAEIDRLIAEGARVALVQCDQIIQSEGWMTRGERADAVQGRGGTSLRPPFDPGILAKYRPDVVAYFTDGFGEAPELPPTGIETLWILVGTGAKRPADWGRVATMSE